MKFTSLVLIFLSFFIFTNNVLAVGRVSADPSSATLAEDGASQSFDISLDEPILAEGGGGSGYVTVNLIADDSRVTLSTSSVTFSEAEWAQIKSFTINTVGDSIHNEDNSTQISMSVVSNSEYYSGFQNTISITLIDDDSLIDDDPVVSRSSTSGSIPRYGCKDPKASNYEYFRASKPSLCVYASTLPSNAIATTSPDLTLGMQSDEVKILQTFLINQAKGPAAAALSVYGATGYFGAYTRDALAEYQSLNGIVPAVGYFGLKTRAQMKAAGLAGLWW